MVNGQGEMKDYVNKKYYINVFASVDINLAKIDELNQLIFNYYSLKLVMCFQMISKILFL